jgi:hypothetical protein
MEQGYTAGWVKCARCEAAEARVRVLEVALRAGVEAAKAETERLGLALQAESRRSARLLHDADITRYEIGALSTEVERLRRG